MRCGRRRAKGTGHQPSACTAQGCNWAQQNEIGGTTRRQWWGGAYQAGSAGAIMEELAVGPAVLTATVVSSLARSRSIPGGRCSAVVGVLSGPTKPAIGNGLLYPKAEDVHSLLDNYEFPSSIKSYEIAGTGSSTLAWLKYHNKKDEQTCEKEDVNECKVAVKRYESLYGDGTVINLSSHVLKNTKNYWFNLHQYNIDNKSNVDHATMLEMNPLIDFITKLTTTNDDSINTSYITTSLPDFSNLNRITYQKNSPLDIHLYDKDGNHTGPITVKDENNNDITIIEENVPNSKYVQIGESASIEVTGNTNYDLELNGYDTGAFTLDKTTYVGDDVTNEYSYTPMPVTNQTKVKQTFNPSILNTPIPDLEIDLNNDNKIDILGKVDMSYIDLNKKEEVVPQPIHSAPVLILSQTNQPVSQILKQEQQNTIQPQPIETKPVSNTITTQIEETPIQNQQITTKQEKPQQTPKKEIKKQTTKKPTPKQIKKQTITKPSTTTQKQINTKSDIIEVQQKPKSQSWFKRIINKLGR